MKITDLQLEDERVFDMVRDESKRQISKWGIQIRDSLEWLAYAVEEQGELSEAITNFMCGRGLQSQIVNEAIQVATLNLKIAEMFLNYEEAKEEI